METIRELLTKTRQQSILDKKLKPETLQKVSELLIGFDGTIPQELENGFDVDNAIYQCIQGFTLSQVLTNRFLLHFWKKESLYHSMLSNWCSFGKRCGKYWEVVDTLNIKSSEVLKISASDVGKEQYLEYVKSLKTPLDETSLNFLYDNFHSKLAELPNLESLGFKGLKYLPVPHYSLASDERSVNLIDTRILIIKGELDIDEFLKSAISTLFGGMLLGLEIDEEKEYSTPEEKELGLWMSHDVMAVRCACRFFLKHGFKGKYIDVFDSIRNYPIQDEDLKILRRLILELM